MGPHKVPALFPGLGESGVLTRHFPGHFREVTDQVKGGSLRLAREGFRFARGYGENLGGCGDVPHHVIRTHPPCCHFWQTSRIHVGSHCRLMGNKGLGLRAVVSRERNLRPCHESNVDLGCFYVLAIVNSAAVNMSTSVFLHYRFLRIYAQ